MAARNPDTGAIRWRPVVARMLREAPQVMRLTVRDEAGRVETIVVTENHPYLRADGSVDLLRAVALEPRGTLDDIQQSRWTGAGFLKAGDTVQSALSRGASDAHGTSAPGTLTVVSSELVLEPTRVYNLEVAGDHTYAVGELQAWVHNANKRKPPPPGRPTSENTGGEFKPTKGSGKYQYYSSCKAQFGLDVGR